MGSAQPASGGTSFSTFKSSWLRHFMIIGPSSGSPRVSSRSAKGSCLGNFPFGWRCFEKLKHIWKKPILKPWVCHTKLRVHRTNPFDWLSLSLALTRIFNSPVLCPSDLTASPGILNCFTNSRMPSPSSKRPTWTSIFERRLQPCSELAVGMMSVKNRCSGNLWDHIVGKKTQSACVVIVAFSHHGDYTTSCPIRLLPCQVTWTLMSASLDHIVK